MVIKNYEIYLSRYLYSIVIASLDEVVDVVIYKINIDCHPPEVDP